MAARRHRPGRTLIVFFLGVGVMYGLVALAGTWKPALGLDLQGGLRITLTAEGSPSDENFEEARRIIDQRVNGSGVVEAEVTAQSAEVHRRRDPWFHREPARDRGTGPASGPAAVPPGRLLQRLGSDPCAPPPPARPRPALARRGAADKPGGKKGDKNDPTDDADADRHREPDRRGEPDRHADRPTRRRGADDGAARPRTSSRGRPRPTRRRSRSTTSSSATTTAAWSRSTSQGASDAGAPARRPRQAPGRLRGRDGDSVIKYLLSRSVIEGTELSDAGAGIPQGEVKWAVTLDIGNDKDKAHPKGSTGGEDDFETISSALAGTGRQFAIVLDGQVLSAPVMQAVIHDGNPRSPATSPRRARPTWRPASSSARCRSPSTRT